MFLIDTQSKKAVSLEKKSFSELKLSERNDLQEWIADNPNILGENLLIIQKSPTKKDVEFAFIFIATVCITRNTGMKSFHSLRTILKNS